MNILFFIISAVIFFVCGFLVCLISTNRTKKHIAWLLQKHHSQLLPKKPKWSDIVEYIKHLHLQFKHQSEELDKWKNNSRRIVSAVAEAVIILNNKGTLLYYNPQSQSFFNIDNKEQNLQLNTIIRSSDVMSLFQQCVQTNQAVTKECSFRIKNQNFYSNFKVTAVPFDPPPTQKQSIHTANIALLFYDQTKMKLSKKAHIDFVSNVSHELKTPLTAMQGFVEVLIHDLSQNNFTQFKKFLNILLKNCRRISNLVDDLLNLSYLSSKKSITKTTLNTKDITLQVIDSMKDTSHKLSYNFSASDVTANERWVEIVLRNLIANARRHTPEGKSINISWTETPAYVVLTVRDQGTGVPEKYRQRIFERFFRMDLARSRDTGGTGVGLALVKQSMEKQGGFVEVTSSSSGGAEFICSFPK